MKHPEYKTIHVQHIAALIHTENANGILEATQPDINTNIKAMYVLVMTTNISTALITTLTLYIYKR
jgi:hypothetical protein